MRAQVYTRKNIIIFLFITLLFCFAMSSCSKDGDYLHGYIEAKLVYLSSSRSGILIHLPVERGDQVKDGDILFKLEPLPESADVDAAQAQIDEASSNLTDLQKGLRPSELDSIQAQIDGAQADIKFFQKEKERNQQLVSKKAIDQNSLDNAINKLESSIAKLQDAQARLVTAKLPARIDKIKAAEAHLRNAKATYGRMRWALDEKIVTAPTTASVFDTYYREGESVQEYHPVLSLLVPKQIKAIFFVPENNLANVKLGSTIFFTCDNCPANASAKIVFVSPNAEYTPPVIYSQDSRSKLVYRIEANLDEQSRKILHPGQPIDIAIKDIIHAK